MDLQQKFEKLNSLSGEEMMKKFSELNEIEKEYFQIKAYYNNALMHLEWMNKSNFYTNKLKSNLKEKIEKYKILIEKMESKQHLAES